MNFQASKNRRKISPNFGNFVDILFFWMYNKLYHHDHLLISAEEHRQAFRLWYMAMRQIG
jgi:hypothetical protein